jgi:hypothetical protein
MTYYLSRAFVEFGPFPSAEMISFHERGLLQDTDYIRAEGTSDWLHVNDWAATQAAPAPVPAPAPKKPAAKKAAPVAAPAPVVAKKAAVKKAKK